MHASDHKKPERKKKKTRPRVLSIYKIIVPHFTPKKKKSKGKRLPTFTLIYEGKKEDGKLFPESVKS